MKNSDIQGFIWALDFIFIWNEVQVNLLVCLTSDCLEPGRRTDVGVEDTYFSCALATITSEIPLLLEFFTSVFCL